MFEQFWSLCVRKEGKAAAQKMWNRLTEDEKNLALQAMPVHAKKWQLECRLKQHIPMPASWLNPVDGRRWEDEIDVVEQKTVAWWSSDQDTLAYGNQKGLRPRPGETMFEYRARLRAA